ncbi:uncharacterized protein LOC135075894 [Ostrinia nubilalis]
MKELGCDIHYITPEMHHSNGQVERYIRTILNMIRIETNHKNQPWSDTLWKLQLVLNITKQKTTQSSPMNLLIGTDGATPVIRNLIRDVAAGDTRANREAWREMCRSRASELLARNRVQQDATVNEKRRPARVFQIGDLVFAVKYSQSTGKLDPGMRGPYKVIKALPSGRYELKLLSGSYGKTTQAAAEYLVLWRGEWCPESCAAFFENDEAEDAGAGPSGVLASFAAPSGESVAAGPSSTVAPSTQPLYEEADGSGEDTASNEEDVSVYPTYEADEDTASNEEDVSVYPTYEAVEDDARSGEAVLA